MLNKVLGVMMSKDTVEIEVTGAEAKLVLKYGYPFSDIEPLFEAVAGKRGWHVISANRYWLEMLAGDLARSMRETNSDSLLERLDAIYCTIETACGGFR